MDSVLSSAGNKAQCSQCGPWAGEVAGVLCPSHTHSRLEEGR